MKNKIAILTYRYKKTLYAHQGFIVLIGVLLVLLGVFLRINALGNLPIDQAYMDKKLSEVKPVKFDQQAIEQIKTLNDSNVFVPETQLPTGRQNPFSE